MNSIIAKKISKILLISLVGMFVLLIVTNIIYAIYDGFGYNGPAIRINGDVNKTLVADIQTLNDEYGIDIAVPLGDHGDGQLQISSDITIYRWPSNIGAKELHGGMVNKLRKYIESHWYIPSNIEKTIPAGSIITPSSVSNGSLFTNAPFFEKGWRKIYIWDVNGNISETGRTEGYVKLKDLRTLYYEYIVLNGLENEFEQLTGNKFTKNTAIQSLLVVDKQLFNQNIANSPEYKYSNIYNILDLVCFYGVIILIILNLAMIVVHRRQWQKKERDRIMRRDP